MNKILLLAFAGLFAASAAFAQTYGPMDGIIHQEVQGTYAPCGSGVGNCFTPYSSSNAIVDSPIPAPSAAASATSHAVTSSLASSLVVKASGGNLYSVSATAVTGAAAGYLVIINATTAPTTGSAITPLDSCYLAASSATGCSISHGIYPINYSTGIVALITTASSPFTYTSGTDTAFISGDYR